MDHPIHDGGHIIYDISQVENRFLDEGNSY